MNIIAKIVITFALFILFFSLINSMVSRSEIYECNKLEKQSKEFSQFFLTKYQNEQCKYHNIIINAPVK